MNGERGQEAIISLLFGIAGMILWFLPIIGYLVTIMGGILGLNCLNSEKRDIAMASLVLNSIGFVLSIIRSAATAYVN